LLYLRDELFELVQSYVRLALNEERRIGKQYKGCAPEILVVGGRGMGKTAALGRIFDSYRNRCPSSEIDIIEDRYAKDNPTSSPGDTPLLTLLRRIKRDLELQVKGDKHPIRFPRLSVGLVAVKTWSPRWTLNTEISEKDARQQLDGAGDSVARIAQREGEDNWVRDWVADVFADLSSYSLPYPVNVFVSATVRAFVSKALDRPHGDEAISWHEQFDPSAGGNGYEKLVAMAGDFSLGGDHREDAERRLVAAFLADLDAAYDRWAWLRGKTLPLVTLDNVGYRPVGGQFLKLVLDCRTARGAPADPLVIVASALSDLGLSRGAPRAVRQVNLTALRKADVLRMLSDADASLLSPDLAHLISRLTGGLPLGLTPLPRLLPRPHPVTRIPRRGAEAVSRPAASG
jgi:hypothetical protein